MQTRKNKSMNPLTPGFKRQRRRARLGDPPLSRRRLLLAFLTMLGLGVWVLGLSIYGLLTDQAQIISRHYRWFPRAESEEYFWASTVFHFVLGACSIWIGIKGARQYKATSAIAKRHPQKQ